MFTILVYTVHVLICFFLIAVVLLQQGKGADLSVFGGGGTQTAFGARGAATVLHKLTVGAFIAFIVTTLTIGAFQSDEASSIIGDLPEEVAGQELIDEDAPTEEEAGALPTGDEASEDAATTDAATTDATASDAAAAEGGDGDQGAVEAGAGDVPVETPAEQASEENSSVEAAPVEGAETQGEGAGGGSGN